MFKTIRSVLWRLAKWSLPVAYTAIVIWYGVNWSPGPTWTVSEPILLRWPVGITDKGDLITLERDRNRQSSLAVYDVATGRLRKRHPLGSEAQWQGVILADQSRVVLSLNEESIWDRPVIVDIESGAITHAASPVYCDIGPGDHLRVSPDGRFVVVREKDYPWTKVCDFQNGKLLATEPQVVFSPDSQRWAELDFPNEGPAELRLRSVTDGAVITTRKVAFDWQSELVSWGPEGLQARVGGLMQSDIMLIPVKDNELGEPVPVPEHYGSRRILIVHNVEYFRTDRWAGKGEGKAVELRHIEFWNRLVQTLHLPGRWLMVDDWDGHGPRLESTWQVLDPVTGIPQSRPLRIEGGVIRVSPDGQWLVTGDFTLRAWHLPPRSPWPITMFLVLLPWVYIVYRRLRSRQIAISRIDGTVPAVI